MVFSRKVYLEGDIWTEIWRSSEASLSLTISQSLPKFMSNGLVMLSNHLILCNRLTLWQSIFPSIRVFSNELAICIRWPKYWSFLPICHMPILQMGSPDSSVGKESTCNAGDSGSIPGSGRSTGEGLGYPLQYSWAFLVAQLVKNLPAMQWTWVQSLSWKDPLEKGKATNSSILAWRIPWTIQSMGCQSQTRLSDFHFQYTNKKRAPFYEKFHDGPLLGAQR